MQNSTKQQSRKDALKASAHVLKDEDILISESEGRPTVFLNTLVNENIIILGYADGLEDAWSNPAIEFYFVYADNIDETEYRTESSHKRILDILRGLDEDKFPLVCSVGQLAQTVGNGHHPYTLRAPLSADTRKRLEQAIKDAEKTQNTAKNPPKRGGVNPNKNTPVRDADEVPF